MVWGKLGLVLGIIMVSAEIRRIGHDLYKLTKSGTKIFRPYISIFVDESARKFAQRVIVAGER